MRQDRARMVAWGREMREAHDRMRQALAVAHVTVAEAENSGRPVSRDLLLFCHGFCVALTGHHEGEDHTLFPAIVAQHHPHLRETIRILEQDHSMMAQLLGGLQEAVDRAASPTDLDRHLEGLAAIMESHFRYEEQQLLGVLAGLEFDAAVSDAFGPL